MVPSSFDRVAPACASRQCGSAIHELERILVSQPADAAVHYRLGVCYTGNCHPHNLVSPDLAIAYLRRAAILLGRSGNASARADVLDGLASAYQAGAGPGRKQHLQAAVACCNHAARIYAAHGEDEECAREEFNAGNLCCDLPFPAHPRKWHEAIRHYQAALAIRSRSGDRARYAAVLQNLGTAWRELPDGIRRDNILAALRCYRKALRVFTPRDFARRNAALHTNIGNAWLSLMPGETSRRARLARRALRHFDLALAVRTRKRFPLDYATTQYNRAFALIGAGEGEAAACFDDAADCFSACGAAILAQLAREQAAALRRQFRVCAAG